MSKGLFYDDGRVQLYHGRLEDVLPRLREEIDLVIADPPYGETSLPWDRWPDGWPSVVAESAGSMWCFGSMRMFLERRDEFAEWKFAQDVVWEKHNGSGAASDRFRRVHEFAVHWYRGEWGSVHHETPRAGGDRRPTKITRGATPHLSNSGATGIIQGQRLATSVVYSPSMHGSAINPTQKPSGILRPLLQYGCPPGGLVVDVFAGSGSTLKEARALGMRAIGIEAREEQCESAALWLAQDCLELDTP